MKKLKFLLLVGENKHFINSCSTFDLLISQSGMSGHTKSPENRDHLHTDIKWLAKFHKILSIGLWVIMFTSDLWMQNDAKTNISPNASGDIMNKIVNLRHTTKQSKVIIMFYIWLIITMHRKHLDFKLTKRTTYGWQWKKKMTQVSIR